MVSSPMRSQRQSPRSATPASVAMACHWRQGSFGSSCMNSRVRRLDCLASIKHAPGGPDKISGWLCAIDQEEAVGMFRRFDSHLVVEDAQLAGGHRRAVTPHHEEIGRKLLRLRRARPHSKKPKRASRLSCARRDIKIVVMALAIVHLVPENSALQSFCFDAFLDANRYPPTDQVRGYACSKTRWRTKAAPTEPSGPIGAT